ncbi:hypothetical protein MUK42_18812 [Musa troglodytarum]|uniref:Rubisco accumulation factor 1, chloroplastic n=1 Tax=Musa troglodytarum TaxID=320322 RepID=A0A9E7JIN8_9LILI|nr:hypothetical protein MUK42_18812 [Musa troglodytarum]
MALLSVATPLEAKHLPLLVATSCPSLILRRRLSLPKPASPRRCGRIYASKLPTPPPYPPPPGEQVYQPFRPPPSPLPAKYRSLGTAERLEILRDRLGLWHEYAPLISTLGHDGFTPPSIEEVTGISGVDQNCLIVAAQVRDSLVSSSFDPELLAFFDAGGGADLLYELRLLNAAQRAAAAYRIIEHRLDPKAAQELARAMKDFPRRRGDVGWDRFSAASPGDCLAYTHFRLSRETMSPAERMASLDRAVEAAETEEARKRIEEEIERASRQGEGGGVAAGEETEELRVTVPVVRLRYGEVAAASTVVLLPVCRAEEGEEGIAAAPGRCRAEGELGVMAAERGWARWVVLPGWEPALAAGNGVAVEFVDGRVLPWRGSGGWEEAVLVVVDRGRREVRAEDGYYLVGGEEEGRGKGLGVERGGKLMVKGAKEALGTVVLVVRPPREEEDDMLSDEDWN